MILYANARAFYASLDRTDHETSGGGHWVIFGVVFTGMISGE
jgi:hypothetical protein